MKFWDTSAVVPLLAAEDATAELQRLRAADPVVVVAWTTPIECASAVARAERDALLSATEATSAFERLDALSATWREVEPSDVVRDVARRLLRVHPLRAADSLQLASAILAAERQPESLQLVTLDSRLAAAARREGFPVVDPGR